MHTSSRRLSRQVASLVLSVAASLVAAACSDTTAPTPARHLTPEVAFCCGEVPTWTATTLALPAGSWIESRAFAINDSNIVAGQVMDSTGAYHAVRWLNGIPALLVLPLSGYSTVAFGISNAGEMVGYGQLYSPPFTGVHKPVRWAQVASFLPTLGYDGDAFDVNMSHVAVGQSRASSAAMRHAVKWSASGVITDLHPAGATSSVALGINLQGDIAGNADFPDGRHAWFWKADGTQLDLGMSTRSTASGINDQRETIGAIQTPNGYLAKVWSPNGTPLAVSGATAPSLGTAISQARRVVGYSGGASAPTPFTVKGATFTVLTIPAGWSNARPQDVNRCGHIVGDSWTPSGTRAVRWYHSACDP